ncbi:SDR family NAD(P)-dependent oxidoreductase [Portibacter marinus]|uniref:SDR family NAD(P)-dependent oxidoreductase n=1 Tax=Portibacter marinus TaxID=2898660 RepID=UPI001F251A5C|nr:SDR family oxidoreductase [Portibacter marinus]
MDKLLLVGGSSGIGKSILELLIDKYEVHNLSRSQPDLSHDHLTHHQVDVLEDEIPEIDGINKIIYCPGTINLKPINSLKEEDFLNDFKVNVLGAVRVIKKYVRDLKRNGNGSILLFSTVAVQQGMPFHSSVAVAKAGVEGLTRSLAAELAPQIRVNCIAPSMTNTPLAKGILKDEKAIERIEDRHPLKRIMEAEDIAKMAVFLISEDARTMTGQVIGIDSGLSTLKP